MRDLYVMFPEEIGKIEPEIYGQFSEHIGGVIYDGIYVGKDSPVENIHGFRKFIIDRMKAIRVPVLRWPGGCFAEVYDWRDGIGEDRPKRLNWWTAWDGRYESNEVGTDEFMDFCGLVGTQPYVAANTTSLTPQIIREWIDYCNSPSGSTTMADLRAKNGHPEPYNVQLWGIGNENWGGGGNMDPAMYAFEYRKYSALADNVPGKKTLIACGPNGDDYNWTQVFMKNMVSSEQHMGAYSMHYYCGNAGDPVAFTEDQWYQQLEQANRMEEILKRHWAIIEGYGLEDKARLVIDEWGCWHEDGSGPSKGANLFEQQSTMRDAAVAALTLNIFNNNCEKIRMACAAQLVNNLHCLFLAAGENCITTPTYHVYDLYRDHQGAKALRTAVEKQRIAYTGKDGTGKELEDLSVSASVNEKGLLITAANLNEKEDIRLRTVPVGVPAGKTLGSRGLLRVLSAPDPHAHNTFEEPETVKIREIPDADPGCITVPAAGIIALRIPFDE